MFQTEVLKRLEVIYNFFFKKKGAIFTTESAIFTTKFKSWSFTTKKVILTTGSAIFTTRFKNLDFVSIQIISKKSSGTFLICEFQLRLFCDLLWSLGPNYNFPLLLLIGEKQMLGMVSGEWFNQ